MPFTSEIVACLLKITLESRCAFEVNSQHEAKALIQHAKRAMQNAEQAQGIPVGLEGRSLNSKTLKPSPENLFPQLDAWDEG